MHCDWDEKAVSGCRRKMCRGLGGNDCKWRQIGMQIKLTPQDFQKVTGAVFEEVVVSVKQRRFYRKSYKFLKAF